MDASPWRSSFPASATGVSLLLLLCLPAIFWGPATADDSGLAAAGAMTDLQKHVAFFDSNKDGIVSLGETYDAFRAFGLGDVPSSFNAAFINGALGPKTRPDNETSRTSIYIVNIYKGIHGSDSGTYDSQGRFVPENFEEIFSKHAKTTPDALNSSEVDELLKADRQPGDYEGWAAAEAEWKMLYSLGKDKDGLLHKDTVRDLYDGSLFPRLVKETSSKED